MEKVMIKASEFEAQADGTKKKVHLGEQADLKPTTIEEAVEKYGSNSRLLSLAWKSYVIEVQSGMRLNGDGRAAKIKRLLAKIESGIDPELTALAKKYGYIK